MDHWLVAQEAQRGKAGTNMVFARDQKGREVALVGNATMGWRLVTSEGVVGATTAHGIEGVFEEFQVPFRGWS